MCTRHMHKLGEWRRRPRAHMVFGHRPLLQTQSLRCAQIFIQRIAILEWDQLEETGDVDEDAQRAISKHMRNDYRKACSECPSCHDSFVKTESFYNWLASNPLKVLVNAAHARAIKTTKQ